MKPPKTSILWQTAEPSSDENALWLTWLVRLRWVAIFTQIITLSFAIRLLWSPWLIIILLGVVLALSVGNIYAQRIRNQGRPITSNRLLLHMTTEIIALTVFFVAAGGSDNPFVVLYVVHIAMAAVMLKPRHALMVTASVILCYTIGFIWNLPLILGEHSLSQTTLIKGGQVIAFSITGISISAFTLGVAGSLRYHRNMLLDAQNRTARTDRLRSVGTLAAGAAHNLNTPLSTIGLRMRRVQRRHKDSDTEADLTVIFAQLNRCKDIVEQLLVGAGDPSASHIEQRPLAELVQATLNMWTKGHNQSIQFHDHSGQLEVEVPKIAFRQALTNLLENAREAQVENGSLKPIQIKILRENNRAVIRIRDQGIGLPDAQEQIGEPFFTTKPSGTGLGVYVARAVAQGAGGGLRYDTLKDQYTEAVWWFPAVTGRAADVVQSKVNKNTETDGRG